MTNDLNNDEISSRNTIHEAHFPIENNEFLDNEHEFREVYISNESNFSGELPNVDQNAASSNIQTESEVQNENRGRNFQLSGDNHFNINGTRTVSRITENPSSERRGATVSVEYQILSSEDAFNNQNDSVQFGVPNNNSNYRQNNENSSRLIASEGRPITIVDHDRYRAHQNMDRSNVVSTEDGNSNFIIESNLQRETQSGTITRTVREVSDPPETNRNFDVPRVTTFNNRDISRDRFSIGTSDAVHHYYDSSISSHEPSDHHPNYRSTHFRVRDDDFNKPRFLRNKPWKRYLSQRNVTAVSPLIPSSHGLYPMYPQLKSSLLYSLENKIDRSYGTVTHTEFLEDMRKTGTSNYWNHLGSSTDILTAYHIAHGSDLQRRYPNWTTPSLREQLRSVRFQHPPRDRIHRISLSPDCQNMIANECDKHSKHYNFASCHSNLYHVWKSYIPSYSPTLSHLQLRHCFSAINSVDVIYANKYSVFGLNTFTGRTIPVIAPEASNSNSRVATLDAQYGFVVAGLLEYSKISVVDLGANYEYLYLSNDSDLNVSNIQKYPENSHYVYEPDWQISRTSVDPILQSKKIPNAWRGRVILDAYSMSDHLEETINYVLIEKASNAVMTDSTDPNNLSIYIAFNRAGISEYTLDGKVKWIYQLPWHPNHLAVNKTRRLISVAADCKELYLFDPISGRSVCKLDGHFDYSFSSAWHPDPNSFLLASGSQDETTRIWDIRYPKSSLFVLDSVCSEVRAVKFSGDGQTLAVVEALDTVTVYDVASQFQQYTVADFFGCSVGAAFSPDSQKLFIGIAGTASAKGSILELRKNAPQGNVEEVQTNAFDCPFNNKNIAEDIFLFEGLDKLFETEPDNRNRQNSISETSIESLNTSSEYSVPSFEYKEIVFSDSEESMDNSFNVSEDEATICEFQPTEIQHPLKDPNPLKIPKGLSECTISIEKLKKFYTLLKSKLLLKQDNNLQREVWDTWFCSPSDHIKFLEEELKAEVSTDKTNLNMLPALVNDAVKNFVSLVSSLRKFELQPVASLTDKWESLSYTDFSDMIGIPLVLQILEMSPHTNDRESTRNNNENRDSNNTTSGLHRSATDYVAAVASTLAAAGSGRLHGVLTPSNAQTHIDTNESTPLEISIEPIQFSLGDSQNIPTGQSRSSNTENLSLDTSVIQPIFFQDYETLASDMSSVGRMLQDRLNNQNRLQTSRELVDDMEVLLPGISATFGQQQTSQSRSQDRRDATQSLSNDTPLPEQRQEPVVESPEESAVEAPEEPIVETPEDSVDESPVDLIVESPQDSNVKFTVEMPPDSIESPHDSTVKPAVEFPQEVCSAEFSKISSVQSFEDIFTNPSDFCFQERSIKKCPSNILAACSSQEVQANPPQELNVQETPLIDIDFLPNSNSENSPTNISEKYTCIPPDSVPSTNIEKPPTERSIEALTGSLIVDSTSRISTLEVSETINKCTTERENFKISQADLSVAAEIETETTQSIENSLADWLAQESETSTSAAAAAAPPETENLRALETHGQQPDGTTQEPPKTTLSPVTAQNLRNDLINDTSSEVSDASLIISPNEPIIEPSQLNSSTSEPLPPEPSITSERHSMHIIPNINDQRASFLRNVLSEILSGTDRVAPDIRSIRSRTAAMLERLVNWSLNSESNLSTQPSENTVITLEHPAMTSSSAQQPNGIIQNIFELMLNPILNSLGNLSSDLTDGITVNATQPTIANILVHQQDHHPSAQLPSQPSSQAPASGGEASQDREQVQQDILSRRRRRRLNETPQGISYVVNINNFNQPLNRISNNSLTNQNSGTQSTSNNVANNQNTATSTNENNTALSIIWVSTMQVDRQRSMTSDERSVSYNFRYDNSEYRVNSIPWQNWVQTRAVSPLDFREIYFICAKQNDSNDVEDLIISEVNPEKDYYHKNFLPFIEIYGLHNI